MALTVILVIVGVLAAGMGAAIVITAPGRAEVMNLTFADVDFSKLKDGIYTGEYKGKKDSTRDVNVQITVESGTIKDIKVVSGPLVGKQRNEVRGGLSIDDLFNNVTESKSLQVDVISGATLTSKSHLKALEDALEKAQAK